MSAPLCRLDDLPDGGVREFDAAGTPVLLWRRAHEVRAYRNRCPHFRIPLNYEPGVFKLHGELLACVHHYSYFRFSDGLCVEGQCPGEPLEAVALRIEDGAVYVAASSD